MQYAILDTGFSRSFPAEHALLTGAAKDLKSAEIVIVLGEHAGRHANLTKGTITSSMLRPPWVTVIPDRWKQLLPDAKSTSPADGG